MTLILVSVPNTTKLGHKRPGEFVSERLLIHGSGYVVFLLFNNPILYVLANIETDHNIRLIIIQACLTLMLQKGYHETPSRLLLSPSRSVFQELERSYCLTVQSIMVWGHMETDHDIHLIIQEAIRTIIQQRGVTRDPGRLRVCFKTPPGPYFRICSVPIVLQPTHVCFGEYEN